MPEDDDKAKKAKRRLLDIRIDEVSLVDNPAIAEEFLLIKRSQTELKAESAMGLKIKAALEAKGMTLEQLAEATQIDLEKLQKAMENAEALDEEELAKVATALDVEKFDGEEPEGASGAKPEGEPEPESEPEGDSTVDPKVEMLHEKLNALIALSSEIGAVLADMGVLQQNAGEQEKSEDEGKPEGEAAEGQPSEHLNPDVAVAKSALEKLTATLTEIKAALTRKGVEKPVEKSEGGKAKDKTDISDHPEFVKVRKQLDDMQKKLEGFEKAGVTKSLVDDDNAAAAVKKDEGKQTWSFFGGDFKE